MIKSRRNEKGRACGTYGGEGESIYDIGGEARRKETTTKI
jgi:hypothetical protein